MQQDFYRLITSYWLEDSNGDNNVSSRNRRASRNATYKRDGLECANNVIYPSSSLLAAGMEHESLIQSVLFDSRRYNADDDLTIKISVGMNFKQPSDADFRDPDKYARVSFVVSEAQENHRQIYTAIGFQIRDPGEFEDWGPYRGIEGQIAGPRLDDVLEDCAFIPDDRGNLGALEALAAASSQDELIQRAYEEAKAQANAQAQAKAVAPILRRDQIPERFDITIKPSLHWGSCSSAVAGGHSVSVAPYFRSPDPSSGLLLGVYGHNRGSYFYEIKFIEVSIFVS